MNVNILQQRTQASRRIHIDYAHTLNKKNALSNCNIFKMRKFHSPFIPEKGSCICGKYTIRVGRRYCSLDGICRNKVPIESAEWKIFYLLGIVGVNYIDGFQSNQKYIKTNLHKFDSNYWILKKELVYLGLQ